MTMRHHIAFIEDDELEIATFRRLYAGDQFELTSLCITSPRSALPQIEEALGARIPDLFVLDLFFPATSDPPGGFTPDTFGGAQIGRASCRERGELSVVERCIDNEDMRETR